MRIFRITLVGMVVFSWLAATALAQPVQKPSASPYNIGPRNGPAQTTQGVRQVWQVLRPGQRRELSASSCGAECHPGQRQRVLLFGLFANYHKELSTVGR